ncbi:MAG: hypothetical protein M1541_17855 [Acidobacteria bacterium]|nr:hypothetical protein [Acidobacteriota bacterium]
MTTLQIPCQAISIQASLSNSSTAITNAAPGCRTFSMSNVFAHSSPLSVRMTSEPVAVRRFGPSYETAGALSRVYDRDAITGTNGQ